MIDNRQTFVPRVDSYWRQILNSIILTAQSDPGPGFNINMSSCRYMKSYCGDKTVVRSFYLHNGISYTGKCVIFILNRGPEFFGRWSIDGEVSIFRAIKIMFIC